MTLPYLNHRAGAPRWCGGPMLMITHIRLDGRGRFYENIEAVWCESGASETAVDVTTPMPKALSIAHLIREMKKGITVYSHGDPPAEVEICVVHDREYIRSKSAATTQNDLLSLPLF